MCGGQQPSRARRCDRSRFRVIDCMNRSGRHVDTKVVLLRTRRFPAFMATSFSECRDYLRSRFRWTYLAQRVCTLPARFEGLSVSTPFFHGARGNEHLHGTLTLSHEAERSPMLLHCANHSAVEDFHRSNPSFTDFQNELLNDLDLPVSIDGRNYPVCLHYDLRFCFGKRLRHASTHA